MPPFGPIKRKDFIRSLHKLGFEGPYSGGRHVYMIKAKRKLVIPNPQEGEISKSFLNMLLKQAGVSRDEWEAL
jgi:predicted RNA binding protein YcfA (HicA-like mRNA interferase family)